ncbi:MAG: 2-amino-4-hydroxy-6-hydroxymethyldihydropteridine diphosphokinase [Bacteroidia bacterium]|nr:2-amino-4-hydroxy-6-hydroxymethyldihydropteridine diphosphokinase [Bacteroidia bacterium]
MHKVFLGIGGNIGNKPENFSTVLWFISEDMGEIILRSPVYETPPWGFHSDENFWNQVLMVETSFMPEELLDKIARIERMFGRERKPGGYMSRGMDIDILYYDDAVVETETLVIPHPLIPQRKFVLVPLADIAPGFVHPLLGLTTLQMLQNCPDNSDIKKIAW